VSIVVAAVTVLALVMSIGIADVARVLVARSHARTAADAAALAAAQELALPSGIDPAEVAAVYAERNDATLTDCICAAGTFDATVTVSIVVDGFLLATGARTVTARARAVVDLPSEPPPTQFVRTTRRF
jgi:Flp pilus assembly protein TadG